MFSYLIEKAKAQAIFAEPGPHGICNNCGHEGKMHEGLCCQCFEHEYIKEALEGGLKYA